MSLAAVLAVALLVTGVNTNVKPWKDPMKVVAWDVKSYYAYLPAAFIYQDLSMEFTRDDPEFFGDKFWPKPTPSGGQCLVMTMGLAYLYLPFFAAGHAVAWLSGAEMTGYSQPYVFFLVFGALAYLVVGLLVLRWLLLRFFPDWIVALTLLTLVAGSNLLYYSTLEAPMSHVYSFFLFAVLMAMTIRWYSEPGLKNSVFVGLLTGLIVLVRPTNILVLFFFLLWDVKNAGDLKNRMGFLFANRKRILLMAGTALLVWLPQLIYWKSVSGQWVYYSYNEEGFFFSNPQFISGLFSYRKGWLLYTPVMMLAIAGIPLLWKYRRGFFWPVLVFFIVNLYVVFSWWTWWYGGSFGQRPLIESYALLSVPLAAFLLFVNHRKRAVFTRFTVALVFLFILHNLFQTMQYHYGAIHWEGMNKQAYWASFARPKPLPGFYDVVTPPDYDLALQGIYANKREKPPEYVVEETIVVDMDLTDSEGTDFLSMCGRYSFSGGQLRSPRYACTGTHSLRLNKKQPYGLFTRLEVDTNQQWHFSIKRRSLWFTGSLVVVADDPSQFYASKRLGPPSATEGWDSLFVAVKVPQGVSFLEIYTMNPGFPDAWFDHLVIRRVSEPLPERQGI